MENWLQETYIFHKFSAALYYFHSCFLNMHSFIEGLLFISQVRKDFTIGEVLQQESQLYRGLHFMLWFHSLKRKDHSAVFWILRVKVILSLLPVLLFTLSPLFPRLEPKGTKEVATGCNTGSGLEVGRRSVSGKHNYFTKTVFVSS